MSQRAYVIVTGASRGIGAATALALAKSGYDIVVNYKSSVDGASTVAAKCVAEGRRAEIIQADVSTADGVQTLFRQANAAFDDAQLVGLVNNAGILPPIDQFQNADDERLHQVVQTNILGPMMCSREAILLMTPQGGGSGGVIVNVGSMASTLGSPNEFVDYATTKGALESLTIGLAKELGPSGISVNCVRPGLIDTDMHASAGAPNRIAELAKNIPAGRGGTAEEVAASIAWLFSEDASYVSGAFINVSGGR